MCTHSTDRCSICFCFVSSISIILRPMLRHKSSTLRSQKQTDRRKPFRWLEDVMVGLIKARNTGVKGCAVFLLCAVLLHYASCDPNMYCILKEKLMSDLPRHVHTDKCVSTRKREKKMLHCNRIVYFFPTKRTVRNAFGPCLFASPYQVYIRSFNL